jgi:heme/copper-type cytochrome/quinol oxidase subunit 2
MFNIIYIYIYIYIYVVVLVFLLIQQHQHNNNNNIHHNKHHNKHSIKLITTITALSTMHLYLVYDAVPGLNLVNQSLEGRGYSTYATAHKVRP